MIQQAVDSGWIAGAVGFIAKDGKIVYDKSFGVSDIEKKTVMHNDDIFRIASQTKAITSVAVMMLFEEGKFLLDDPISKYIPEFANPVVPKEKLVGLIFMQQSPFRHGEIPEKFKALVYQALSN
jgi:CubicO group peptidase (beta-lactamase class C family)